MFPKPSAHALSQPAVLAAAMLCAQLLTHPAAAAPPALNPALLDVIVKTTSSEPVRGRVVALNMSEGVTLEADGQERLIPWRELVRIDALHDVTPRNSRDSALTLIDGDRLLGQLADCDGDSIVFEARDFGRVRLPLEAVAGYESEKAHSPANIHTLRWMDRGSSNADDRLLLTNGDTLHGFITTLGADGATIDSALGKTTAPLRNVLAVRLAAREASPIDAKPYALIRTRGGARVTATTLDWKRHELSLQMRQGPRVTLDAERVLEVEIIGGRWEWLSRHEPISTQHTPMLARGWEVTRDRNVRGGPITIAGQQFTRGIGVHSRSRLVYELKGEYQEFVASFGIDDDSGPHADVAVSVLVDGQKRVTESGIRRGKLCGPIRVDVTHANRMELVVDFGANGDVQDRFNWVEAALVRE